MAFKLTICIYTQVTCIYLALELSYMDSHCKALVGKNYPHILLLHLMQVGHYNVEF